ncbi:MAG: FAD-dependent thymidylate synthase [Cetobacterium sp.]|uniref:FAD-dependent thymidylate synthase n=1 Tax=Cetobacterium sp. TaxID=2071632 RepID=UPI003EE7E241
MKDKQWQCQICGDYQSDFLDGNSTFEEHLEYHKISEEQYYNFININKGGTSKMRVKLLSYSNNIELVLISFIQQTWGPTFSLENLTDKEIENMVNLSLSGKTLSTSLEAIKFTFQIDGLSRSITHQLVRQRIGSAFSQKGMSDTYYGDIDYVIPATIEAVNKTEEYLNLTKQCNKFYKELFELGVPFQDARYIIPHGATSSIVWAVDLLSLKRFCSIRMGNFMSWEINTLAKAIREEIKQIYPKIANILKPNCENVKKCISFGNLFEGCGKFPMDKRDYVFLALQNCKNLQFDEISKQKMLSHNQKVKYTNNFWRVE